jgi:hypothetical protein
MEEAIRAMISYVMLLRSFRGIVANVVLVVWIAVALARWRSVLALALLCAVGLALRIVTGLRVDVALPAKARLLRRVALRRRVLGSGLAHLIPGLIAAATARGAVVGGIGRSVTHGRVVEVCVGRRITGIGRHGLVVAVHGGRGRVGWHTCGLVRMGGRWRSLARHLNSRIALVVNEGAVVYFTAALRTILEKEYLW